MSVVLLNTPSRQQLKEVETHVDAYGAFLDALYNLKTPNFLALQNELAHSDLTFAEGQASTDLDGALRYIARWSAATDNLGRDHRTTELAYSTDGTRMVCLDYLTVTQTGPVKLLNGKSIDPGDRNRTLQLRNAHFIRLADDGSHKIVEWRISHNPRDFYDRLR